MMPPIFSQRWCCAGALLRRLRARWSALPLLLALAGVLCLSGCSTVGYYNVTDFDTVVVDAGHGGHDSGASTRGGRVRLREKDLTLDVARRINGKLRAAGFRTIMTRADDRFITLDDRVDCSNAYRRSVFVSIHFNDTRRRAVHGAETYHNRHGTWQLAERIEHSLASMPEGEDRGVRTARYRVLRKSDGPALLVECGYLSNPAEAQHCASAVWREQVATRIANAIVAQRR
ncbi:MAG: N-acetylmuramoyl-L-alanine amidase [Chthoniobacteraceae bacterium]|nr:N-acetylmuramoyl-L-alanine amidase [Chthoniobacteraceae bacterium]